MYKLEVIGLIAKTAQVFTIAIQKFSLATRPHWDREAGLAGWARAHPLIALL